MKRHLNTLFLTQPETTLKKEGEAISVRIANNPPQRFPIHNIGSIVCFSDAYITPSLMEHCVRNHTSISYLSPYGKFKARVTGPVSGNVLLRKEQYRWSDSETKSAEVARYIIIGKILNSRSTLVRYRREHRNLDKDKSITKVIDLLSQAVDDMRPGEDLNYYRGIEGSAAQNYFSIFDLLILTNKQDFFFIDRNKRPPKDRVNALLSFAYSMLMNDVRSALEVVGLDTAVGFLHRDRPGRPSLALDMMEEFRSSFCDRFVLTLINSGKVRSSHFKKDATEGIFLNDDGRRIFLTAYQERKQKEIYHPYIEEKTTIGLLFHLQALIMARFIRGDIDGYPPYKWR